MCRRASCKIKNEKRAKKKKNMMKIEFSFGTILIEKLISLPDRKREEGG